jgi:acyl carrier protein
MNNPEERLKKCFTAVFPSLSEDQISSASVQTVKEWDSAAAITLIIVMEEEFSLPLDFEAMAEMDSFSKLATYLKAL